MHMQWIVGNLISEVQCNASLVESRCLDQQPSHVFYLEFTRCSNTNDALYDSLRSKCHFTLFILWAGVNVDEYERFTYHVSAFLYDSRVFNLLYVF